jgi:MSHA pilin protein MshA
LTLQLSPRFADSGSRHSSSSVRFYSKHRFFLLEIDMSKASQRGFTLIELVVVIVILGVLAAFAVPRFMGLETEARVATLNGLAGSVRSASAMAHSLQLAQGVGADSDISVNGTPITMANGYPDLANLNLLLEDTTGFTYDAVAGEFEKVGANTPDECKVTYAASTAVGTPPTIAVVRGGC